MLQIHKKKKFISLLTGVLTGIRSELKNGSFQPVNCKHTMKVGDVVNDCKEKRLVLRPSILANRVFEI